MPFFSSSVNSLVSFFPPSLDVHYKTVATQKSKRNNSSVINIPSPRPMDPQNKSRAEDSHCGPEPGQEHHAIFTVFSCFLVADHAVELPAGLCLVDEGGTPGLSFIGACGDLPARGELKELLDAFDADLLDMDEVSDAPEPLDVVFRIEAVLVAPCRFYQSVLFVEP